MLAAAKANPNQKYVIIDSSYGADTPKNVVGTAFADHEIHSWQDTLPEH